MFTVYALFSKKFNKIYVGQTDSLDRRIVEHNEGTLSKYTKRYIPWEIVYTEIHQTRADAMKREKQLKSQKGREFIWKVIKDKGL